MSYPIKDELITGTLDLPTLGMREGDFFLFINRCSSAVNGEGA